MSSRANSSARNRRAGPSTSIQDALTNNQPSSYGGASYGSVSNMQQTTLSQGDKQEHKLLSITQAFMLINGKIRNLENQVDTMNKVIETHNAGTSDNGTDYNNDSVNVVQPNYEEMSDVSEFKQNIEDDFFDHDSKTSKNQHEIINHTMIPPFSNDLNEKNLNTKRSSTIMFDENKAREVAEDVTGKALETYDSKISNLDSKSKELESEYNKLNIKTEEISHKLNSIEQLIKNIETLNTKLPDFMESVDARFESLKLNNKI